MYNYKNSLNESSYKSYEGNADIIEKLGEVDVFDTKTNSIIKYSAKDIIKVCVDAQYKIQRD